MSTTALYARPWKREHFSPTSTVSLEGGCAMHGVDVCDSPATVTVVFPTEKNGACDQWVREHPEVEVIAEA